MDHREQLEQLAQLLRDGEKELSQGGGESDKAFFLRAADWLLSKGVQLSEERPSLPPDSAPELLRDALKIICDMKPTTSVQAFRDLLAVETRIRLTLVKLAAVRSVDSLRPPEPRHLLEQARQQIIVLRDSLGPFAKDQGSAINWDRADNVRALLVAFLERGADSVAAPEETKHE